MDGRSLAAFLNAFANSMTCTFTMSSQCLGSFSQLCRVAMRMAQLPTRMTKRGHRQMTNMPASSRK